MAKFVTIAASKETRDRIRALVLKVSAGGWKSIGSKRTDTPTITAVVEYAIELVEKKLK